MTHARTILIEISRFTPGRDDPARFQPFRLEVDAATTVLDCLERIRLGQDPSLTYHRSCHHGCCGTCACRINGLERLACATRVLELGSDLVRLEPLAGFARIGDLAVDMHGFFRDIDPHWSYLKPSGPPPADPGLRRLEDCIECGACVSACPEARARDGFMGPAALAALHNEMLKNPSARKGLLATAGGERGERGCRRALACSRVCPAGVYPARHIAVLRRTLGKNPD